MVMTQKSAVKSQSNWMGPTLAQITELKCFEICITEVILSIRSRNLVSRVGHAIPETMPKTRK